jgi:two-component system sensor histidine kinase RegB
MSVELHEHAVRPGRNVRLDTLVRLRWVSVVGQTTAVLLVYFALDFALPIWACLAVIALAAWLNVALRVRFHATRRIEPDRAAWLLAFDIAEIAILLFLTGGLQNPFSFLLLGPVLLSAAALPPRMIMNLGCLAALCASVLAFYYYPLPWYADQPLRLPGTYITGVWIATLLALGFIAIHAWQLSEESRQLADALAATELVLAREQHLSQLDGLAAAAAHELGSPLSTITVIATDLERAIEPDSPYADDIGLLREQAQRCRAILAKLTELSSSIELFDRMPLSALIEEVVAPHRNFGVAINVTLAPQDAAEPIGGRNPAILYGLGNLVENAVDFAGDQVDVTMNWSAEEVAVTITDDGPGFAPEIMARIGEPYVTSTRRRRFNVGSEAGGGLGLGFFIAKTLLERSGATLTYRNRAAPERGAIVQVHWARGDFEVAGAASGSP